MRCDGACKKSRGATVSSGIESTYLSAAQGERDDFRHRKVFLKNNPRRSISQAGSEGGCCATRWQMTGFRELKPPVAKTEFPAVRVAMKSPLMLVSFGTRSVFAPQPINVTRYSASKKNFSRSTTAFHYSNRTPRPAHAYLPSYAYAQRLFFDINLLPGIGVTLPYRHCPCSAQLYLHILV